MKNFVLFLAIGLVGLVAGLAFAISPVTTQPGRWAFPKGIFVGTGSATADRQAARLGGSYDYDFPATTSGVAFSPAITKSGAAVGDICKVSAPAAASALNAEFGCVVTAADTVKITFTPRDTAKAQTSLVSGTPSTAIVPVPVSSICTCTPVGATAAIAAAGCATGIGIDAGIGLLTMTGPNTVTTTMTYDCAAPVDPADGGYAFELTRNGT